MGIQTSLLPNETNKINRHRLHYFLITFSPTLFRPFLLRHINTKSPEWARERINNGSISLGPRETQMKRNPVNHGDEARSYVPRHQEKAHWKIENGSYGISEKTWQMVFFYGWLKYKKNKTIYCTSFLIIIHVI